MRVLHVIHSMSPRCGGPTTAMWNILDALSLAGVQADLATTDDDGPDRLSGTPLGRFTGEQGHRVIRHPRQLRPYTFSAPLLQWLLANVHRYDVVEAHGLFTFAPIAAAAVARARGVGYLLRPNGVLNRWGRTHRRPQAKRMSLRLVEGPLLRHAARVVFTSPAELQEASELGIDMRSMVVPLALARPGLPTLDGGSGEQAENCVLFVGRIDPIKNLEGLLRAVAAVAPRYPGLRLSIAGDGDAVYLRRLHQLATSLGLESRTEWLGFVQGPAKEAALRRAGLLVLPSASENFGLAAAEALARGIPVVVTTGVGIAHYVGAAEAGFVCEPTDAAIAAALHDALADRHRLRQMGRAGRQLYERELSLESLGARLRETYEAIRAER